MKLQNSRAVDKCLNHMCKKQLRIFAFFFFILNMTLDIQMGKKTLSFVKD